MPVSDAIRKAAARGHHNKVRQLLDDAAATVAPDVLRDVLWHGCLKGRPSMIEAALDRGIVVDCVDSEGTTGLMRAAMLGRNECIRLLLDRGAAVDRARADGRTALVCAGQHGDAETMRLLVAAGASLDHQAADGTRAVAAAAASSNWDSVRYLVEQGASVDASMSDGSSLLDYLARSVPDLATLALEAGADPGATAGPAQRTPLHGAARGGDAQLIRRLLDAAADIEARDFSGATPLMLAVGSPDATEALLAGGADPNATDSTGETALLYAMDAGDVEVVKSLLTAGARPQPEDPTFQAPLHRAAGRGRTAIVELLLDAGADPDHPAAPWGATALMHALRCGAIDTARLLRAAGASVTARDARQASLMAYAARAGDAAAVEFLLAEGVPLEDSAGPVPLVVAALEGGVATLRALLAAGADPNSRWPAAGGGGSALGVAVQGVDVGKVEVLLAAGADPDGGTPPPLLLAAQWGWDDERYTRPRSHRRDRLAPVIEALLQAGADPDAQCEGRSALAWAQSMRSRWVVRLLRRHGAKP